MDTPGTGPNGACTRLTGAMDGKGGSAESGENAFFDTVYLTFRETAGPPFGTPRCVQSPGAGLRHSAHSVKQRVSQGHISPAQKRPCLREMTPLTLRAG